MAMELPNDNGVNDTRSEEAKARYPQYPSYTRSVQLQRLARLRYNK